MQSVTLNNGVEMPILGFGVYQVPPEETQQAVESALAAGYRHLDTAQGYMNEEAVGRAITASGIAPDDLFVTTKLWVQSQPTEVKARAALEKSLELLGLDRVDLFLIHQPLGRLLRLLACHGEGPRRRPRASDRCLELLPGPADRPDRAQRHRAGGQPDRDPPVLPACGLPGADARARRPDRVVGPVRRGSQQPVHRSAAVGHRCRARPHRGAGGAALAHSARRRRDPEVRPSRAHGTRTSTSSTSNSPTRT